jgi:hypothetical protein
MYHEQPKSMNHMSSKPPSNSYIVLEEVDGLMLELVR